MPKCDKYTYGKDLMVKVEENIDEYIVAHSQPEPQHLEKLNRETNQKVMQPRMLSGHYQGRVLSLLSKMKNPRSILEGRSFHSIY